MTQSKRTFRVALLGIYHESNTFLPNCTSLEDFKKGHLLKGEEIRLEYASAFHEIGGMLEVLDQHQIELVPILYAEATPGGTITADAFDYLVKGMLDGLEKAGALDACLVVPHGAAVSEKYDDMDGHWLSLIRKSLGKIPIVGTIDPHANVSSQMIDATDALIAYATNPHIDQRETGRKAADLLVRMLQEGIRPKQNLVQLSMAIGIEQQNTSSEPCRSLYRYVSTVAESRRLLHVSVVLGFPYADVPEMGTSFIVITQENWKQSHIASAELSQYMLTNKARFIGEKKTIHSQLHKIVNSPKPVLLLDMGDNVGGGSTGDSTYLLEALEKETRRKTFICIYDPLAVRKVVQHKLNSTFNMWFGKRYPAHIPYLSEITLLSVSDGKFKETLPRHGGQVSYDMGQTAIVSTQYGNIVMLISNRIAPFSLSQLTAFGIVPKDFDVIIAKGVNAPIAAYGPVCPTIIQIDTPGVTQADMTRFTYHKRRKPLFPFESVM